MKKLFFGGFFLASIIIGSLSVFAEGDNTVRQYWYYNAEQEEWCDHVGINCLDTVIVTPEDPD